MPVGGSAVNEAIQKVLWRRRSTAPEDRQTVHGLDQQVPSSTGRSVIMVAGGTLAAQFVAAAATPLLTRLYGPEVLGTLASVLAYAGMVGPVAGLCLPTAIVLASGPVEAANIGRAARLIALPCAVAAAGAAPWVLQDVTEQGVPLPLLTCTVLTLVLTSVLVQVSQQEMVRSQTFRLLGMLTAGQAVVFAAVQVAAGVIWPDPALLVGVSSCYSLLFLALALGAPRYRSLRRGYRANSGTLRHVLRKFADFPRYRAPQVLVNSVGVHLPTLVLAALVDVRVAGLFMVTQRVLTLPVMFVGKSISDVIYPQVVTLTRSGQSSFMLLLRWTLIAALTAAPIGLVLVVVGEPLFALVLGEGWGPAGSLAQALVPWMVGALLCRPSVGAVAALGLQRFYLYSDLTTTVAKSALLVALLTQDAGAWRSLFVWAVVGAIGSLWITVVSLRRAARIGAAGGQT